MKLLIILAAVLMLAGCSEKNAAETEIAANPADGVETSAVEESEETEAVVETEAETEAEPAEPAVLYGMTQAEADEAFGELLDGLFTGKTTEKIYKTGLGSSFGFHFPDILYVDGEYWAYYICYRTNTGKGGVGLATSTDGFNWTDKGCVIQPDEDYDMNGAYFAGVWRDTDGKFYIAYECKGGENTEYGTLENIAVAVSDDGITWDKQGVALYKQNQSRTYGVWQSANVGTPDLYKVGDTWYMTFHGFNFADCQIGVASGEDIMNLEMEKKPVIPTKTNTAYSGTTGRRDVIYVDGWYYMVYEVSTDQAASGGFGGADWSHMFARSRDMIEWETIEAPLIKQNKSGFGYDGTCWMVADGKLYVYMRDAGNSTTAVELVPVEE